MNRKTFLKNSLTLPALLSGFPALLASESYSKTPAQSNKKLNAYYFRAHMYTMVPHQVREDLKWMADIGTNTLSIAVLEQDLFAAVENIEIVCNEANKLGMDVYAVPSRWGGLLAGAPKVPSLFTIQNPQANMMLKDGTPRSSYVSGRVSSVHYPETFDFFCSATEKLLDLFPIKGIIWDEPKGLKEDYSEKAIENLGKNAPYEKHIKAACDFFSRINAFIKNKSSEVVTCLFEKANLKSNKLDIVANIKHLDYLGCDGRPWRKEDGGVLESSGKILLGEKYGERFLSAAKAHGKKSLWLLENHNMKSQDIPLLKKRMPEIMEKDIDHLIYYYYPRNLDKPDEIMNIMKHFLKGYL